MARTKPPRKAYRPRHIDADPFGLALAMAAKLHAPQRDELTARFARSFAALRAGQGTPAAWADLADAMNVAEALAERGIANDHAALFARAQAALAAVAKRQEQGRGWTLYASEITALDDALYVHQVQLEHCSQREFAEAVRQVQRRIAGALRGQLPAGAQLCSLHAFSAPNGNAEAAC